LFETSTKIVFVLLLTKAFPSRCLFVFDLIFSVLKKIEKAKRAQKKVIARSSNSKTASRVVCPQVTYPTDCAQIFTQLQQQ
jgi:hypothetical protein